MTDVFISYKREDREHAQRIAEFIAARGYDVWWDVDLLPGDSFADEINAILSKTKVAIVLWTPESVGSPWVKSEAAIAFDRGILIPVRLRATAIPAPFNSLQTLDLTSWGPEEGPNPLGPLLKAIETRVHGEPSLAPPVSNEQLRARLERPKHEVEFWSSISQSPKPSAREYRIYLERYGDDASFADLARGRIEDLSAGRPGRRFSEILTVLSVAVGIAVGCFTIAEKAGILGSGSSQQPEPEVRAEPEQKPEVSARPNASDGSEASASDVAKPTAHSVFFDEGAYSRRQFPIVLQADAEARGPSDPGFSYFVRFTFPIGGEGTATWIRLKSGQRELFHGERRLWVLGIEVLAPSDERGTMSIRYEYADPAKRPDVWIYVPALRKAVRLGNDSVPELLRGMANRIYHDARDSYTLEKLIEAQIGKDVHITEFESGTFASTGKIRRYIDIGRLSTGR